MALVRGLVWLVVLLGVLADKQEESMRKNPIRKVVTMLQRMQERVREEGKAEAALYQKFKCYCKTGAGDLSKAISSAGTKIPQVQSSLEEAKSLKTQIEADLVQHKKDRAEAKDAVAKANAIREKEAAAFAKESSDYKANIAAMAKAITAIGAGASGSFLQSSAAVTLKRLTVETEMNSLDRDMMAAFLSHGQAEGYVPQSGQILGILNGMKDTMDKSLGEITAAEEESIKAFEALVAAKQKEINANSAAIESKLARQGELGVEIVEMEADLGDTADSLAEDKKFLADLEKNCETKEAEWDTRSKIRTEELAALAETIKILNDDDALELFKKTLPSSSLLQVTVTSRELRRRALAALVRSHDSRLNLVALALRGSSGTFDKVLKMIDEMVVLLGKEQTADDEKKTYCETELDKAEDEKKGLDLTVTDLGKAIDEAKGASETLAEEISALKDGIKVLDKQVEEANELRKDEHAEFTEVTAANAAAKKLLGMAKNRLAKFYTPKLHKTAPKSELSREDRIMENMAFAQVAAHSSREAPSEAPETWDGTYQKKGEEHGGVVEMLDMLVADLDKDTQEKTVDEKDAQAEYETFTADSQAKRAADSKSIAEKESAKADLEANIQQMSMEKKATSKEAMAKAKFIFDLHSSCDWLLSNFEVRKKARAGEVDSLKNAKAVLAGADFEFLQLRPPMAHLPLRGRRLRGEGQSQ